MQNLEGKLSIYIYIKMWCAVDNHNFMYHICAKGF